MAAMDPSAHSISSDFKWSDEYDATLERIASADIVETEWIRLRDMIKYKIDQNISSFLADADKLNKSDGLRLFSPQPSTPGGLKLPPFLPRPRDESNPNEAPKSVLTQTEADAFKETLYLQLDVFEGAPFTIQRLSELCVRPREHYTSVGKYLRALEKTLYVTSTWDSFPPLPPQTTVSTAIASTAFAVGPSSVPSTPLFSPIPFSHSDARRSKSRSPPPSPLALNAIDSGGAVPLNTTMLGMGQRALGLVDELDDPRPGHLSDRPKALSSVTTVGEGSEAKSLDERFVRSSDSESGRPEPKRQKQGDDAGNMLLDDHDGDKENKS
ncbi:hypothetical protein EW146_g9386 [Bondarzewia mesenterica]|uniref:PPP4R2-domain-containing protein n=1 Tax=Bondarzewia mesenterica TaxID=1095465 RepID=A0A4S4L735_9AGAM|nr:hypothetical protein EW146_g9386 [Bondarzewia mesenterica]